MKNEKEAKLFDPAEMTREAQKIRRVDVDGVGTVKYTCYSLNMMMEVAKEPEPKAQGIMLAFQMMKNAYPTLTLDDVKSLPPEQAIKLIEALARIAGALKPAEAPAKKE